MKAYLLSLLLLSGCGIKAKVTFDLHGKPIDEHNNFHQEIANIELFRAIEDGNLALMKSTIDNGADVYTTDESGHTTLMQAVCYGKISIATILVEQFGVDVCAVDHEGKTALHYLQSSSTDIVLAALLLSYGAYVDAQDDFGNTPLLQVVSHNYSFRGIAESEVSNLLEFYGANRYQINYAGECPNDYLSFSCRYW